MTRLHRVVDEAVSLGVATEILGTATMASSLAYRAMCCDVFPKPNIYTDFGFATFVFGVAIFGLACAAEALLTKHRQNKPPTPNGDTVDAAYADLLRRLEHLEDDVETALARQDLDDLNQLTLDEYDKYGEKRKRSTDG